MHGKQAGSAARSLSAGIIAASCLHTMAWGDQSHRSVFIQRRVLPASKSTTMAWSNQSPSLAQKAAEPEEKSPYVLHKETHHKQTLQRTCRELGLCQPAGSPQAAPPWLGAHKGEARASQALRHPSTTAQVRALCRPGHTPPSCHPADAKNRMS
eukprot:1153583-Pelagomonas_calceolata.AAC.2